MLRAAALGVVDFSGADLSDRRWWARCYLLLTAVKREDDRTEVDAAYAAAASVLAGAMAGQSRESREAAAAAFASAAEAVSAIRRPWEAKEAEASPAASLGGLDPQAAWEAEYGKLADPEVQRAIGATVAALQAAADANRRAM